MFKNLVVGQRVKLVHRASVSVIDSVIVGKSQYGSWIEIPDGIVIYEDDFEGWEIA